MKHSTVISNEFSIQRVGNGVELIQSCNALESSNQYPVVPVHTLLDQPFSTWLCDHDCAITFANDECAEVCGMNSTTDFNGKTAFDFLEKRHALVATRHDVDVMLNNKLGIIEYDLLRLDGHCYQTLNFKFPLYNETRDVIGTFGCGIILGRNDLAASLTKLIDIGLLNINDGINLKQKNNSVYLSRRELQCLRQSIRGKSARQVAIEIGISQRTVEEYLNNIKLKMGVKTKAEMIDAGLRLLDSCITDQQSTF